MAAFRRGKKAYFLRKKSKKQRWPRKNVVKQRKLPSNQKKNVCVIRLPKSSYLRTCPLVAWYFNRRIHNDVLSFRRHKSLGSLYGGSHHSHKMPLQAGKQKKLPRMRCTCPSFLKDALKEVANKKRAKWVVAPAKKKPRYSDEEIFYRLADPSEDDGDFDTDAGPSGTVPGFSQPVANEPQAVSS